MKRRLIDRHFHIPTVFLICALLLVCKALAHAQSYHTYIYSSIGVLSLDEKNCVRKKECSNSPSHILIKSSPVHSFISLLDAFTHLLVVSCHTVAIASALGLLLLIEIILKTHASILLHRSAVGISSPYSETFCRFLCPSKC